MKALALLGLLALSACRGPELPAVDAGDAAVVDAAQIDAAIDAAIDATVDAPVDATVDAPVDAAVDAPSDATTDAPVDAGVPPIDAGPTLCEGGTEYRVGPTTLTHLQVNLDQGVLYAAYLDSNAPGVWLSATTLDGHAVRPPVRLDTPIVSPNAIAVRGDALMVVGNNMVHRLSPTTGAALAPARALVYPTPSGSEQQVLVPGPGNDFRVLWLRGGRHIVDRDGVVVSSFAPTSYDGRPIQPQPDGSAWTGMSRPESIGGCVHCGRAYALHFDAVGGGATATVLNPAPNVGSGSAVADTDGAEVFVAWWEWGSGIQQGLRMGRLGHAADVAIPGIPRQLIVTGPATGALVYDSADGATVQLARFNGGGVVSLRWDLAQSVTLAHAHVDLVRGYAIDRDHVVTIDIGGLAHCWRLPP